jgi:hypothetical protein
VHPATQVVVASKFDNRLKEFSERWEVDRYLSATGYLHPNIAPFFVALPKVCVHLPVNNNDRSQRERVAAMTCPFCLSSCEGFHRTRHSSWTSFGKNLTLNRLSRLQ